MVRKVRKEYVAVNGRLLIADNIAKSKLLYTMRLFRDTIKMAHYLMRKELAWEDIEKRLTSLISNAHYGHSAYQRAKLWKDRPYLKLRKKFLFSVGKSAEKGNRNIRLIPSDNYFIVKIKIPHADGRHEWIECKAIFGKRYIPLLKELSKGNVSYGVEIGEDYKIHVHVPLELYARYLGKNISRRGKSLHIAGFDLNADRINMVIINSSGELLDFKVKHFPEVTQHGFPKERAKDIRLKALSELIDYACYHNVEYFVFEKLGRRRRKKTSNRNINRKLSKFPKKQLLTHAKVMVAKRGKKFCEENPAFSSQDAELIAKKLRLDTHTTSAYILAYRYLKSINT
ncbi:MAG: hypothetical protein DRJ51_05170 [Thermoprotei archaeon]|nr:MAG: hypothetical protein DRJ51_05170 [Thermoprotei archaeon]